MFKDITIRTTGFDDMLALRTMHAQSWLDTYPSDEHGVSRQWVAQRVARWTTPEGMEKSRTHFEKIFGHPQHLHQVALRGLEVVGVVHASNIEDKQRLEALYVEKSLKGSGLAHHLMGIAMAWYDTSRPVELEVISYNDRARTFYEKYGFDKVPHSDFLFSDVMPAIVMERKGDGL